MRQRPRQAHRHDPAGPDGLAEPAVHDRRPGRRADPGARGRRPRQRLGAGARPAEVGAHPVAGDARDAVPARDVGRHAPAHRRRHRHLLRAAPADRRRADHQPRPDDPGAVPQPAARPAARARPGADLHHPQSRHRRQDVRPARGDVCRARGRVGAGVADLQRAGASLHRGAAQLDPAHERRPTSGSPRSTGQPPDLSALPPGCAFAPRCPRAFDRCRDEAPPEFAAGDGRTARCWLAAVAPAPTGVAAASGAA